MRAVAVNTGIRGCDRRFRLALGSIARHCGMTAVEDISVIAIVGTAFGAITLAAVAVVAPIRLAVVVVVPSARCVSRFYTLDTPAAALLTFGSATAAAASPVTAAVLGFVIVGTIWALAVAAKDVRVCAANSS